MYLADAERKPVREPDRAVPRSPKDPISGTVVKLAGETQLARRGRHRRDGCQAQVRSSRRSRTTRSCAFEDAELHFFGGERAPLASPAHCGAYTTNASFAPWSGSADAGQRRARAFQITSGPNGTPCPGPTLPFSPSLTGGTTNINAGAFSPLDDDDRPRRRPAEHAVGAAAHARRASRVCSPA